MAAIAIAFFWRGAVTNLSERMKRFGGAGFQADFELRQDSEGDFDDNQITEGTSSANTTSKPVADIMADIQLALSDVPVADRIETALLLASQERLHRVFAFAYINIFGSQINLLKTLNSHAGFISDDGIASYVAELPKYLDHSSDLTVEKYTQYLVDFRLLQKTPGGYQLTDYGREFLKFLPSFGLSDQKPL